MVATLARRLKCHSARFVLLDSSGAVVSHATSQMDTFYSHSATSVEMPLAALLNPGAYTVQLTLGDSAQGARAEDDQIPLTVDATTEAAPDPGVVPGLIGVIQSAGGGQISVIGLCVGLLGALVAVIGLAWILLARRRRRRRLLGLS